MTIKPIKHHLHGRSVMACFRTDQEAKQFSELLTEQCETKDRSAKLGDFEVRCYIFQQRCQKKSNKQIQSQLKTHFGIECLSEVNIESVYKGRNYKTTYNDMVNAVTQDPNRDWVAEWKANQSKR